MLRLPAPDRPDRGTLEIARARWACHHQAARQPGPVTTRGLWENTAHPENLCWCILRCYSAPAGMQSSPRSRVLDGEVQVW